MDSESSLDIPFFHGYCPILLTTIPFTLLYSTVWHDGRTIIFIHKIIKIEQKNLNSNVITPPHLYNCYPSHFPPLFYPLLLLPPHYFNLLSSTLFFSYLILSYLILTYHILSYLILSYLSYTLSDEDSAAEVTIPFTVLSANSTAESVFGSVCGQQLISYQDPLGDNLWGTAMEWMPQFDHLDFLKQMFPDRYVRTSQYLTHKDGCSRSFEIMILFIN